MIHEIINLNNFLDDTIFSGDELTDFLFSGKIGIILLISYKKARQWPYSRIHFSNENLEEIPLFWAFLCSDAQKQVNLFLDIHPMKCFPSLYSTNNNNRTKYPIPVIKRGNLTWGGCQRYDVNIAGKQYGIKQHEYCSAFGLPDDCFDIKFSHSFFDFLDSFKDYVIWCFEKNDFLQRCAPKTYLIKYMKDEFLPKKSFFYVDTSAKFLSGLFKNKEISKINDCYWYQNGKDFIRERNYDYSGNNFRFEESSLEIIKEKAIFEFIRQLLLIKNQERYKAFSNHTITKYDENEKIAAEEKINAIITQVKFDSQKQLDSLLGAIAPNLDNKKLRTSHFLVMDVEFVNVNYPTRRIHKDPRSYKFPCIFSSIIWNSRTKKVEIDINVLTLPCHFCKEECREIKKHSLKYSCIYFANSFISKQISFFEHLLAEYESFKIFSYGKSDFKQLERSDNFFINSFDSRVYHRTNRKRALRIVKFAKDISLPEVSLDEIEEVILKKWIIGWSREGTHVNVNRNFTTRMSTNDFSIKYKNAIETCVSDSISTFLYLLFRDYLLNDKSIKWERSSQTTLL